MKVFIRCTNKGSSGPSNHRYAQGESNTPPPIRNTPSTPFDPSGTPLVTHQPSLLAQGSPSGALGNTIRPSSNTLRGIINRRPAGGTAGGHGGDRPERISLGALSHFSPILQPIAPALNTHSTHQEPSGSPRALPQ